MSKKMIMIALLVSSLLVASCSTSQSTNTNTGVPIPTAVATSTTGNSVQEDATPAIVAATNAFLETLDDSQKNTVLFDSGLVWADNRR